MVTAPEKDEETTEFTWSAYNGTFVRFEKLPEETRDDLKRFHSGMLVALETDRKCIIVSEPQDKHQTLKTRVAIAKFSNEYEYVYTLVPKTNE